MSDPNQYKITDWTTGEEKIIPLHDNQSPTPWWIDGWECGMIGIHTNPYDHGTIEAGEWEKGHDAAVED